MYFFSFLPPWLQILSGLRWFIHQAMDVARLTTAQFTQLLAHGLLRTSLCLFPLSSTLVRDCSDSEAGERQATGTVTAKGRQAGSVGRYHKTFLTGSLTPGNNYISLHLIQQR